MCMLEGWQKNVNVDREGVAMDLKTDLWVLSLFRFLPVIGYQITIMEVRNLFTMTAEKLKHYAKALTLMQFLTIPSGA